MMTEGREINPDQISPHVVHPALHQDYASDFRSQRATDIAPTLTSPILTGIASSMLIPKGDEPMETEEVKPLVDQTIDLDATIPANLPKDLADVVTLDDDESSFTDSFPEAVSTPIVETAMDRKQSSEDTSPSTSPPKRRATEGMVDPALPVASLPKGTWRKTCSRGGTRSLSLTI